MRAGSGWQEFPPSSPRPVDGGLTARSARGEIGEHWWSRRFVTVLESFALGTRLTRGKAYARKGQVISLEVARGVVTASVQGSRRTPYRVRIALAPFPELVWAKVEVALTEQAVFSALLLAGQMPPDLESVFAAAGAPLFPAGARELTMSCTCPDSEVPCKHIAATFYLLAERFDDDPFEILHWRGRPRARLLERLAALRGADSDPDDEGGGRPRAGASGAPDAPASDADAEPASAQLALAPLVDAAARAGDERPAVGWPAAPQIPALPAHPALPVDLLLRQMPPAPPALGGADLVAELAAVYRELGVAAEEVQT